MKIFKIIFFIIVYTFAAIGLFLTAGYFAVKWGWTNTPGAIDQQRDLWLKQSTTSFDGVISVENGSDRRPTNHWSEGEEWEIFTEAVRKDVATLKRVEAETGVPARLIVSVLAVEQLRLFNSERQLFKELFSPLKLLGAQTQFSWGVMGIKPETAQRVEENLVATTSMYYLGQNFEHYLDFKTSDHATERFERITNWKDRYYGYLYGALFMKQIMKSWADAGFDISSRPEIIGTLYNIGFDNSIPKANPQVGGASISLPSGTYTFGRLAEEIYMSSELIDEFPRP